METNLKNLSQKEFFCFDDAEKEMTEWIGRKSKYHSIEARVNEIPKYRRGRPENGVEMIGRTLYSVQAATVEKKDKAERLKEEAGCFVLLSNVPEEGETAHTPTEILQAYKDQYGIEQNFGFLKDPVIVKGVASELCRFNIPFKFKYISHLCLFFTIVKIMRDSFLATD